LIYKQRSKHEHVQIFSDTDVSRLIIYAWNSFSSASFGKVLMQQFS
jgi:hypothetical protein